MTNALEIDLNDGSHTSKNLVYGKIILTKEPTSQLKRVLCMMRVAGGFKKQSVYLQGQVQSVAIKLRLDVGCAYDSDDNYNHFAWLSLEPRPRVTRACSPSTLSQM